MFFILPCLILWFIVYYLNNIRQRTGVEVDEELNIKYIDLLYDAFIIMACLYTLFSIITILEFIITINYSNNLNSIFRILMHKSHIIWTTYLHMYTLPLYLYVIYLFISYMKNK